MHNFQAQALLCLMPLKINISFKMFSFIHTKLHIELANKPSSGSIFSLSYGGWLPTILTLRLTEWDLELSN